MFARILENKIKSDYFKGKVLILVGARQVGKTTLIQKLQSDIGPSKKTLFLNLDNPTDKSFLEDRDFESLDRLFKGIDIIFIDEAQRVENIGLVLKLLVDNYKSSKQIIATGSSSLNLLDNTSEPLTGRKFVYHLFPLSLRERYQDVLSLKKGYEQDLIFGMYPEIHDVFTKEDKIRLLRELSTSYLYKDILEFQDIRNPEVLGKLLRLLALQVGCEVSYSELASAVGIDYKTVERYIDLLEKSYVVFRLGAYSTNKRREIAKNKKVYFYDLGIRNAIIDNFNNVELRTDVGALWENFMVIERMKHREYNGIYANQYFWRTYDGREVDLVEEREGKLYGYEFKWGKDKASVPVSWRSYENASYEVFNRDNFESLVF